MPYAKTTWVDAVTKLGPTHLNNIEDGISKAPYGPDASANNVPIWNGSGWTYGLIANANISATAAIAKSKLAALSIVDSDVSASAAIAQSKVQSSLVNGTRAAVVSTAGTTFAAGADVLTSALSFTADGVSSYRIRAEGADWGNTGVNANILRLNLDGADGGYLGIWNCPIANASTPLVCSITITPAAGNHTVNARLTTNAGTASINGGTAGAGNRGPILVTVGKV